MTGHEWIELGVNLGLLMLVLAFITAFGAGLCLYAGLRDRAREAAGEVVPRSLAPLANRFFPPSEAEPPHASERKVA